MISKILHKSLAKYMATDGGTESLRMIMEMRKHAGWQHYATMLMGIGNDIANIALSREFQKKTDKEKLIMLEAFSYMSDFIKFTLNPNPQLERILQIQQKNREASLKKRQVTQKGERDGRRKGTIHRIRTHEA